MARLRKAKPLVDDSLRGRVEDVLDMLLHGLELPEDRSAKKAVRRIPVYVSRAAHDELEKRGTTLPEYVTEPAEDYRADAERAHHNRVRELRQALDEGDDPDRYQIAWLALSVGAGAMLPDSNHVTRRLAAIGTKVDAAGPQGGNRDPEDRAAIEQRDNTLRHLLKVHHNTYRADAFAPACETVGRKHGGLSGRQMQRICADLRWKSPKGKTVQT